MIFLYPTDYFDKNIADDIFEQERKTALSLGFSVALFDPDSPTKVLSVAPASENDSCDDVLYRGWQVSPDEYTNSIYPLMSSIGTPLITPQEYALMHSADGYYDYVCDLLPNVINASYDELMSNDGEIIPSIFDDLGDKVFVKDYIKSVYGMTSIERYAGEPVQDTIDRTKQFLNEIASSRGDAFAGGFTFKEWVDFDQQVRCFVYDKKLILCTAHDGQWNGEIPNNVPTNLPSRFYTVDMGHDSSSGKWYVVECGDGQVSDFGDDETVERFYHTF